jgi:hypothetical protein
VWNTATNIGFPTVNIKSAIRKSLSLKNLKENVRLAGAGRFTGGFFAIMGARK